MSLCRQTGGLALLVFAFAASSCSNTPSNYVVSRPDGQEAPAGTEGGPCHPDGTCNPGLTCLSDLCVVSIQPDAGQPDTAPVIDDLGVLDSSPDVADSTPDLAVDTAPPDLVSNPCKSQAECDDGLTCTTDFCTVGGCVNAINGGYCLIAGQCVVTGTTLPSDPCQRCDPATDNTAWSHYTCVTTAAGSGTSGFYDGPAQAAKFSHPRAIGLDPSGKIYVADSFNRRIRLIDGATVSTHAGSGMRCRDGLISKAQLCSPYGLVTDGSGKYYFSDAHAIRVLANNQVSTLAGQLGQNGATDGPSAAALFDTPRGLAIDSSGKIYVADSKNHQIRVVWQGQVSTLAGSGTAGSTDGWVQNARFNEPMDVAVDSAGKVYVADHNNHRIRVIDGTTVSTLAGSSSGFTDGPAATAKLKYPAAVAVDSSGQVFVADRGNYRIRLVAGGQVTTFAGTGTWGSADGPKDSAQFGFPYTLSIGPGGELYIGDGCAVREISGGHVTTIVGKVTSCSATFAQSSLDGPLGSVVVSSVRGVISPVAGTIVFMDQGNHRLRKIASGQVSTLAGTSWLSYSDGPAAEAQFIQPLGLAVESSGRLVIADSGKWAYLEQANTIRSVEINGQVTTLAGQHHPGSTDGTLNARFKGARGVAVASNGDIYIADTGNHKIRRITAGMTITIAGDGTPGDKDGPASSAWFNQPYDVAVDSAGKVYVADRENSKIRMIDGGQVTTFAGTTHGFADGPAGAAMFNKPEGVAVNGSGKIFVADTENHRVRVIEKGQVTTLAGMGVAGYLDGPASKAVFNRPADLALDAKGNVYVVDAENHRIRKIVP